MSEQKPRLSRSERYKRKIAWLERRTFELTKTLDAVAPELSQESQQAIRAVITETPQHRAPREQEN